MPWEIVGELKLTCIVVNLRGGGADFECTPVRDAETHKHKATRQLNRARCFQIGKNSEAGKKRDIFF